MNIYRIEKLTGGKQKEKEKKIRNLGNNYQ